MGEKAHPLEGRRVLVTRAPHQASDLADRLRALGAVPVLVPTIEIAPPASWEALDAALRALPEFDLIAFTSSNGVEAFHSRSEALGVKTAPRSVAVVGPATARAAEKTGLLVDIMPPVFTAESLAETLRPNAHGLRALLVLAEDAPPTLRDGLTAAGAEVTIAPAYSNRIPDASLSLIRALFDGGDAPDAVMFTSASTARNLAALLDTAGSALPERVVRASIGPITSRALAELGLPAHVQALESTIASLVDALEDYFQKPVP